VGTSRVLCFPMSLVLCLLGAAGLMPLDGGIRDFTLSWEHSVEQVRWEEDWRVEPAGLRLVEARVVGSGAGMEAGEGAVWRDGAWAWRPDLPPQPRLVLANSAHAASYRLCTDGRCRDLPEAEEGPTVLAPCEAGASGVSEPG
jgi:hypothetical protein